MGKRANPMAVKAALTYEIDEAATALGKSPATNAANVSLEPRVPDAAQRMKVGFGPSVTRADDQKVTHAALDLKATATQN